MLTMTKKLILRLTMTTDNYMIIIIIHRCYLLSKIELFVCLINLLNQQIKIQIS